MARTVNTGAQDFKDIIENNDFYVDKTDFIREWWENRDTVTLITRPRRFGKTLNLNMLNYFFSLNHAGKGDLFEGLSIWKDEKYRKLQGTYPVIFLSFADIKEGCFENAQKRICRRLTDLYTDYFFISDSGKLNAADKHYFDSAANGIDSFDAADSLYYLSKALEKYYGKKPIILLDEYDTPMQEAYLKGYWDEMAEFMRSFFNSTFKTNPYLKRGLMTGITRVSKESIFSDLNNLEVVSTTSEKYETSFGFTEKEVSDALAEFGLQAEGRQVMRWYDGFRFGSCENIYNPWSITKFLEHKKFMPYWVNTSSNALVGRLIQKGSRDVKIAMENLLNGKTFKTPLDEEIVFHQLDHDENAVWSFLLASGYLKVVNVADDDEFEDITYELSFTNNEVRRMFIKIIRSWFSNEEVRYGTLTADI